VTGRPFWIFEFDSESGLVTEPEEAVRA
jgi:hypothetical protein